MKRPLYSSSLHVRLDPPLRDAIQKLAASDDLRTSEFVRRELRKVARGRKISLPRAPKLSMISLWLGWLDSELLIASLRRPPALPVLVRHMGGAGVESGSAQVGDDADGARA